MMNIRGIEFGNVHAASGVQGFFGEGYWFHMLFNLTFNGVTFVSKTTTLFSRKGNMALSNRFTPVGLFPRCVRVKPFRGLVLNSVGLSGPGLQALLDRGEWQARREPFIISIMSVAESQEGKLREIRTMIELIRRVKFKAPFALQINLSCPNTGHNTSALIRGSEEILEVASVLGVPVMPKYSIASAPLSAIIELQDNPHCDAICVSNTLPFGWEGIDWQKVWGTKTSPIAKLGGGGLSGKVLKPLVCEWISRLRDMGFTKPINGGGGILETSDVDDYHRAGASSVFVGSVAILRPWRVASIVERANELNWSHT